MPLCSSRWFEKSSREDCCVVEGFVVSRVLMLGLSPSLIQMEYCPTSRLKYSTWLSAETPRGREVKISILFQKEFTAIRLLVLENISHHFFNSTSIRLISCRKSIKVWFSMSFSIPSSQRYQDVQDFNFPIYSQYITLSEPHFSDILDDLKYQTEVLLPKTIFWI
jgi:hypothetical protein